MFEQTGLVGNFHEYRPFLCDVSKMWLEARRPQTVRGVASIADYNEDEQKFVRTLLLDMMEHVQGQPPLRSLFLGKDTTIAHDPNQKSNLPLGMPLAEALESFGDRCLFRKLHLHTKFEDMDDLILGVQEAGCPVRDREGSYFLVSYERDNACTHFVSVCAVVENFERTDRTAVPLFLAISSDGVHFATLLANDMTPAIDVNFEHDAGNWRQQMESYRGFVVSGASPT